MTIHCMLEIGRCYMCNYVIANNNKCATSSCGSNGISYGSAYLCYYTIRTITTQSGVEYSVNGTVYQSSNSFAGLAPGSYTLYVRNLADPSCVTMSGSTTSINSIPPPPVVPTTASVTQPTCAVQSGSISVTTQSVEYSLDGTTYQASNIFRLDSE
jgi:hypothetical protein